MKIKALILLTVISTLILSSCGQSVNGIPKDQFSTAEQVAYDFTKAMYSGKESNQYRAMNDLMSKDNSLIAMMSSMKDDGVFSEHYSDIKVMKLIKEKEKGETIRYILLKLTNGEGSRENIVSVYKTKVQLIFAPNDKIGKEGFERLRKKF
ncbi:hypothetical protein [Sporolactobacillus terrae]|uniref:hypothetical protein n=1 Tax=Sporolactobacillus terrae TaxID=269673 RepID=UPI00048B4203|nr:hypothetical protein [Sporolactobacillus terrae]UAK17598.1 hypothetical protein K7399_06640 [Sporolactobacillus terrae]